MEHEHRTRLLQQTLSLGSSAMSTSVPTPFPPARAMHPRHTFSALQRHRMHAPYALPTVLRNGSKLELETKEALGAVADHDAIKAAFPTTYGRARVLLQPAEQGFDPRALRVGVVLSGGQAPGGHNVIAGIFDYIKALSPESVLIGFLDGPQGIYNGHYCEIDGHMMDCYRNSGGFDMIGSGRHKIEKPAEFAASLATCVALDLDGVIVIGGDDSNTNAALLAEYFEANHCRTKVCGAPKTIDGDLKVDPYIPTSFGFDTACQTYSELIGNLGQDTLSTQKYYHFVRLMGRAASNITLECALQTRPNVCLISEEVEAGHMTLAQITQQVVDTVLARAEQGKDYGIVLLPEGLIEFIPEFNRLIEEINDVLATGVPTTEEAVLPELSYNNRAVFSYLPDNIKQQLLLDRDPHGNVQVAKIETEKLLAQTVSAELEQLRKHGKYSGSFCPQFHSYGYEGRSGLPSLFDSTYCYVLGQNVAALIALGQNGLISSVTNLNAPISQWRCGGVPISMMCHLEKRQGHMKPVIKKALVELDGAPFNCFKAQRADWAKYDLYRSPGPMQFPEHETSAEDSLDLSITLTLELAGSDPRMDTTKYAAAMQAQDAAILYSDSSTLRYAPLKGDAACVHSVQQRDRAVAGTPPLCPTFRGADRARGGAVAVARCVRKQATQCSMVCDGAAVAELFPNTYGARLVSVIPLESTLGATVEGRTIGICFCGRQAAGGHDIIAGIFDALADTGTLVGFVGGTRGLCHGDAQVLDAETIASYRGIGGYELLGRSMDRISGSDYDDVAAVCEKLALDGLILVGGSRTCTDAAYLSEHMVARGSRTAVLAVPSDMGGSIKNQFVETTVGFDTSCKVSAQICGNNATDGASAKKYYYFQRLMGQEPSQTALEVALASKPNYVILGEEVRAKNMSLHDVVKGIADMVEKRAHKGMNYGTVIIPEGLIESIPEFHMLIRELETAYGTAGDNVRRSKAELTASLTVWSRALLESLPEYMQSELLFFRCTSVNKVQLSQAETERVLAHFVDQELAFRKKQGTYKGSFSVVCSFIGYQSRGAAPSNFDRAYAYNLGFAAVALIAEGASMCGYLATINNLRGGVDNWQVSAVPLTALLESGGHRSLRSRPEVPCSEVNLNSPSYQALEANRMQWETDDMYENPGPIQYVGPCAETIPHTLQLESFDYLKDIEALQLALDNIREACRPGCEATVLHVATKNLEALKDIICMVHTSK